MENQSKNGNIIAIITMMFLYAMISFVTNLAAPIGVIWKNVFADSGSANMIGMLGNAMNFLAYLFMGIPAGKLLTKIGYKKTAHRPASSPPRPALPSPASGPPPSGADRRCWS